MVKVARRGFPDGTDAIGRSSHRRAKVFSHPCGGVSLLVGISFMVVQMIAAHY
jgi:hypothetical protein